MHRLVGWPAWLAGVLALCLPLVGCGHSNRATAGVADRTASVLGRPVAGVGTPPMGGGRTVGEFGKFGTGAGEFEEPFGIVADPRSGDVYVVDTKHARVEKFTGAGRFLLGWGWGVADGKTPAPQTCTKRCFPGLIGVGAGQFYFPEGIAIDNDRSSRSYGDLYVVEIGNHRVEKFSPTGKFLLMFGGGVNQTAHMHHQDGEEDICPVERGDVCGAGVEGANGGALEFAVEGSFIAVGSNGAVYVGQRDHVKIFSPEGVYRSQVTLIPRAVSREGREPGGVSALAVNAAGDMYVVRNHVVGVDEYSPSGTLLRTLEPGGAEPSYSEGPTPSLALDLAGNIFIDVFADEKHLVAEYSPSGVELASFDEGKKAPINIVHREDGLPGMAYDPKTTDLYLVNVAIPLERVRIVEPPRL